MDSELKVEVDDDFDLADRLVETLKDLHSKDVILKRFGFEGEPKTLKQISKEIGVTIERVRQIEKKSLRLLREKSNKFELNNHDENWGFGRKGIAPIPPPEGQKWIPHFSVNRDAINNRIYYKGKRFQWKFSDCIEGKLKGEWEGYLWRSRNTMIFEGKGKRGILIPETKKEQIVSRLKSIGFEDRGLSLHCPGYLRPGNTPNRFRSFRLYPPKYRTVRFFRPNKEVGMTMLWMIVYEY